LYQNHGWIVHVVIYWHARFQLELKLVQGEKRERSGSENKNGKLKKNGWIMHRHGLTVAG
jgi:hypothetical protein